MQENQTTFYGDSLSQATGPVRFKPTNDYMFRAMLQRNNEVLKGLLSALLRIPVEQMERVEITNPIKLGKAIGDKQFILDVLVKLNNYQTIHLEMQVTDRGDWTERSMSYAFRTFDSLVSGEEYLEASPLIQIGILDYTLFKEQSEFYAVYQFTNIRTHNLYSDKLKLCVLDLTRMDLATEEDIESGLLEWTKLFKAETWEEIKMIAKKDKYIAKAAETVWGLSQEQIIRLQCAAREDLERSRRKELRNIELMKDEIADLKGENAELQAKLGNFKESLSEKDAKIAELEALLHSMQQSQNAIM